MKKIMDKSGDTRKSCETRKIRYGTVHGKKSD